MSQIMLMQIENLDSLYPFKFKKSQRKWRTFEGTKTIPDRDGIPEHHRGKLLVFYDGCKQVVLSPKHFVIVDDEYLKKLNQPIEAASADDLPF